MRLSALLLTAALVPAVQAQEPSLYQARQLLEAGQASAALQILEGVAQTRDAMEWRARAHIVRATQTQPSERCAHLLRALEFASAAGVGDLVELARKASADDGCAVRR